MDVDGPERVSPEVVPGVHGGHEEPRVPPGVGEGKGEQALGMIGRRPEEPGVIGIAADDPIEGYDVGWRRGRSQGTKVCVG